MSEVVNIDPDSMPVESADSDDEPVGADNPNVCEPIYSLKDLRRTLDKPPEWVKSTIRLERRHGSKIKNSRGDCHVKESEFKPSERLDGKGTAKTLVCHDMKGGYLLDKYINGINVGNGFTFHRWSQIDIFCYFSHYFITIPTLPWINLSHKFGTAIIGTVITEFTNGEALCGRIFKDVETYKKFADDLVEICHLYKFDGWLLNIENAIKKPDYLIDFVKYLTEKMHEKIPESYVIWYDSVSCEGKLDWQNELNEKNRCFFDVCDGIFLNYTWKEEEIARTKKAAGNRNFDVFVGIDVWGRGSYGGGSFNAYKAAKVISDNTLSMAIFAHGWVHEDNPRDPQHDFLQRYYSRSSLLWKLFWPYLYTTPINRFFTTFFRTGVTSCHYNLSSQDMQLSYFPAHADTSETIDVEIERSICKCVQERVIGDHRCLLVINRDLDGAAVHRLFATDIEVTSEVSIDCYTDAYKDDKTDYEIILIGVDKEGEIERIVCGLRGDKNQMGNLRVITPDKVCPESDNVNVIRNWERRRFRFDFSNRKILEIGMKIVNGDYLHICGFAINSI